MTESKVENKPGMKKAQSGTGFLFLIAGAVLIISMAAIYSIGLVALSSNRQLEQYREVTAHLEDLLSTLKDAETGQRGYLLTREPRYLDPYNQALGEIHEELQKLSHLAESGDLPSNEVSTVTHLIGEKLAELAQTVQLCEQNNLEKALEIVRSEQGKAVMDSIRAQISKMQEQEVAQFQRANHRAAQATARRNGAFLIITLSNLAFLTWAYRRIANEMRGRVQAQFETQEAAARLASILDNLAEGVVACDMEGNVTHWNRAALDMHGFKSLKEAQRPVDRFIETFALSEINGNRLPQERWPLRRVLQGEEVRNWDVRVRHLGHGWHRVFSYTGCLVRDSQAKPFLAVLTINDITQRTHLEEELRQNKAELERRVERRTAELAAANKELEAFGYSVSHDLRAPLRHVSGFIKLLAKTSGPRLDEEAQLQIKTIAEAAERMGHLIDDLLILSRIGRASLTEADVSLGQLVEEARQQLAPEMAGRNIDWQIGNLPQIRGDITLLRSAVLNLVSNAVKYTRARKPAFIEVESREENGETVVFVRDNGAGFDMQFVDKLFGVFQRLHDREEFEGTGVGLASVRRIVQRHGGRTWAEGAVNQGATFYFSIPKERVV